jgi:uncharacterized protein YecT (DUF1311 family)
MTNLKFKFFVIFISICFTTFSQTKETVDSLETQYQACLDKGQFMLGCSEAFYFQMDSLLNLEYKKLRSKCDSIQKENLKDEQLQWLSKRDKQFKQNQQQEHKNAKEGGYDGGQDETMMLTDDNAKFVKERVLKLIDSTPQNYSADKYKRKSSNIHTTNR